MTDSNFKGNGFSEPRFATDGGVATFKDRAAPAKHADHASRQAGSEKLPSLTIACFPLRAGWFFVKLAGSLALAALGGFLAAEIPKTPGLTTNLVVVSTLSFLGAAALLVTALRDATGRLIVDDTGIAFRPTLFGSQLAWSDVVGWRLSTIDQAGSGLGQLMIWIDKEALPVTFDTGWLNETSRVALRKVLRARLGSEE